MPKPDRQQTKILYALALPAKILSTDNPRIPDLEHDLIECSVCHKLIEEPNIEECEFCNEDVCDKCWDKHRCEQEFASYE